MATFAGKKLQKVNILAWESGTNTNLTVTFGTSTYK